jgi:predicted ATPase/DNA-binding CsgD family transcriptional regulator
VVDDFHDGVCFVPLAPITDPDLVISAVLQALNLPETSNQPLLEGLKGYLLSKQVLLLLDNFEQVVTAAPLLAELLVTCAGVKILVTSRELLHLYGEYDYLVPPLSLPHVDRLQVLEMLSQHEALQLFVQRAQAVSANFELTESNAFAVAKICLRLDGLPLAIELASARILVLPPEELLARLDSRLKLLTGGARNLPERQRTLQATLDWSYNLLNPDEQTLFRRLGVFVGGCTLKAVEEICGSELGTDTLDGVTSLVGKSLLQRQESPLGGPRFHMLETIREYAGQMLDESAEPEQIRERHADYFLNLVEEAIPQLLGPHPDIWLDRLDEEHNNLRTALEWSMTQDGTGGGRKTEKGLRLVGALVEYWNSRGYFSEGRQWCILLLSRSEPRPGGTRPSAERAKALLALAFMTWQLGDVSEARPIYERSLGMFRTLGDDRGLARVMMGLGNLVMWLGEYDTSLSLFQECLAIGKKLGERRLMARALSMTGVILMRKREYRTAQPLMEEAAAIARELGDDGLEADTMVKRGSLAIHLEEYERAKALIEEGLGIARALGIDWIVPYSLARLGLIALRQGEAHNAEKYFLEGLASVRSSGIRRWSRWYLVGLAEIARLRGMVTRAAQLLGASEGILSAAGAHYEPATSAEIDRVIASVRAELDEESFERLLAEGRAMSLEEIIPYTSSPAKAGVTITTEGQHIYPDDLTEREVEVLRLIAAGKSNQQIAQELVLSVRTVERHISNIYLKIGAHGKAARVSASTYATRHGLTAG